MKSDHVQAGASFFPSPRRGEVDCRAKLGSRVRAAVGGILRVRSPLTPALSPAGRGRSHVRRLCIDLTETCSNDRLQRPILAGSPNMRPITILVALAMLTSLPAMVSARPFNDPRV